MIRILTDNDVNGHIITGVLHRKPGLDLIRVVDANLTTADNTIILAWAAANDRIVLSSDQVHDADASRSPDHRRRTDARVTPHPAGCDRPTSHRRVD